MRSVIAAIETQVLQQCSGADSGLDIVPADDDPELEVAMVRVEPN